MKKMGLIIVVVLAIITVIAVVKVSNKDQVQLLTQSETLSTDKFDIVINDFYNANYYYDKNSKFDKYVAVDVSITNNQDIKNGSNQTISALTSFRMADKNTDEDNSAHQPVIDENYKEFSKMLAPGETFDITLTFPVDDSSSYILYFNRSMKSEDEQILGWELDGKNLATKDVGLTLSHELPGADNKNNEDSVKVEDSSNEGDKNE